MIKVQKVWYGPGIRVTFTSDEHGSVFRLAECVENAARELGLSFKRSALFSSTRSNRVMVQLHLPAGTARDVERLQQEVARAA